MQAELFLSPGFCTCPTGHAVHVLFAALKYSLSAQETHLPPPNSWDVNAHMTLLGGAGMHAVLFGGFEI